jgi:tetratricopeptide (TPR) repeat protein
VLRGFGEGEQASRNYAQQALSLLSHGRKREASAMLALAARYAEGESFRKARRLSDALGDNPDEPRLRSEPPVVDASLSPVSQRRLREGYASHMRYVQRTDLRAAFDEIKRIPGNLLRHSGAELRFLRAYLAYKAGDHSDCVGELESLARTEPHFVLQHPELYFYLGRSHDALQHFDKAVRNLRLYIEATALMPSAGVSTDDVGAPTTDLPGASPKLGHTQPRP